MIRFCEYCGKEIDEEHKYGSGRFCNKSCQCRSIAKKGGAAAGIVNKKRLKPRHIAVCPACGKEFETLKGVFCSKQCSTHYSGNKSRKWAEEAKKRLSVSEKAFHRNHQNAYEKKPKRFCSVCGKSIIKRSKTGLCLSCCRSSKEGKQYWSLKAKSLMNDGVVKSWTSRNISSFAESFWKKVLENNKVNFEREFVVPVEESKCYFLDFLICVGNSKIDLEIDGKQHKYEERAKHDIERDKFLTSLGYTVYRIEWNSVNTEEGQKLMKEKIDKFLRFINVNS